MNQTCYSLNPGHDLFSVKFAPDLLSALKRFTSLFGMGKGGSTSHNDRNSKNNYVIYFLATKLSAI